jgi:hypothetical protein
MDSPPWHLTSLGSVGRSVFSLVVFCRAVDAACLHRWISGGMGETPPTAAWAAAVAAADRVFVEYAFFAAGLEAGDPGSTRDPNPGSTRGCCDGSGRWRWQHG